MGEFLAEGDLLIQILAILNRLSIDGWHDRSEIGATALRLLRPQPRLLSLEGA